MPFATPNPTRLLPTPELSCKPHKPERRIDVPQQYSILLYVYSICYNLNLVTCLECVIQAYYFCKRLVPSGDDKE